MSSRVKKYLGMYSCALCNGRTRVYDWLPDPVFCTRCRRNQGVEEARQEEVHHLDSEIVSSARKEARSALLGALETIRECEDVVSLQRLTRSLKGWQRP